MDLINQAMDFVFGFFWQFFEDMATWIYSFLPDANYDAMVWISNFGYIVNGQDLSFNLYYFIDMPIVFFFLSMWGGVTLAGLIIMAIRFLISLIHDILDSVPAILPLPI